MPQHYSFNTEVTQDERCFVLIDNAWQYGICTKVYANLNKEQVRLVYGAKSNEDVGVFPHGEIASFEGFNEWRSRLIDTATDVYKFKGNVDNVFGPPSFDLLIPMYLDGKSPTVAYMASMGLLETDFDNE